MADLIAEPAVPCLFLLGYRDGAEEFLRAARSTSNADVSSLRVEDMREDDGIALARVCLADSGAAADSLASEAGNNPFLIELMSRRERKDATPASLRTLVHEQLQAFGDDRLVVELVCTAGGPILTKVLLAACEELPDSTGVPSRERGAPLPERHARASEAQSARTTTRSGGACTPSSTTPRASRHHARLARVMLELGAKDPEALAHHYRGAGDLDRGRKARGHRRRQCRRRVGVRARRRALLHRAATAARTTRASHASKPTPSQTPAGAAKPPRSTSATTCCAKRHSTI